jgi:catechol 2,3-dioxygenase-like lactoylglutathione lyase family enzyme
MSAVFKTLHHVCIVVRDIDKAVAYYETVGIGPWQNYPPLAQYVELHMPNRDAFMALRYKFANLDNVQIQLCEPSPADSPQRRFLDQHGEGVFHIGFEVADCNDSEKAAKALGLSVLMRGRRQDGSGFTYFNTADEAGGVVLEIRASSRAASRP